MIRDLRGRAFDRVPRRVVSLVPSLTETLFDIGAGDSVVAITDFCIFPPDLAQPRVGGTKNPRVDEIRALAPDLVHMNLEENLRRHADAIEAFAPVFVSEPKGIDDVVALIEQLGQLHGVSARASELAREIEHEWRSMPHRPFTFACPIWKKPWMWCGGDTYVSRLVEAAGGQNVLADHERYPSLSLEDVLARKPQVIFLPDEPYLFTNEDASEICRTGTPACPGTDKSVCPTVIGPFPGHLFTWHGSRTLHGLRWLREALARAA